MARKGRHDRGLVSYRLGNGDIRWRVRVWRYYKAYKWSGFPTKSQAREFYEDRKRDIREGKPFTKVVVAAGSFASVVTRYLAQASHKKNVLAEENYARFWISWFHGLTVLEVTGERIERARIHLLTVGNDRRKPSKTAPKLAPLTHATVNRYVAWLKHVLMIEERSGRIPLNPCRQVPKFGERNAPETRFTPEQEAKVRKELGPEADYPTLAIQTGLREGELFGLAWEWLNLERGIGALPDPKAGEPQVFIINSQAKAIFRRLKVRANGSKWVFPSPRDPQRSLSAKAWYANHFKPACKRAGIVLSRQDGRTFHTLRHEFAGRMQEQGVEVKDLKDAGRWKSWQAMARYLKRDVTRIAAQVEKLSRTAPQPSRS